MKEVKSDLKGLLKEVAAFRLEMVKEFAALRSDVAELKGKVSQLPSTLQLLGFIVAVVVASGITKHFFP